MARSPEKGCPLDPILQDTVCPNASAKSDQPPAWRTLLSIEKPNRKERPIEEWVCPSFSIRVDAENEGGHSQEREASGGPTLPLGDLPRPQMLCTELCGEHLVDCQLKGSGV